ncbi:unnamed protein product [Phaedon cochleariae]|uniref:RRM domain-containing protein n=1 Tax=Phaedon cochleariae TaxID=80249 RepID=A0A9P0DN26_PHACE|nr:unnamed protein product [Phaedon cochleariae]
MDITLNQLRGRLREINSRFDAEGENGRDRSLDRGREPRCMRPSPNRVYVANIPYEFRWQDLKDLFRTNVGEVAFVEMFVDDRDNPKGSGIVEFTDFLSVGKCLTAMRGYEVKCGQSSRQLVVRSDEGNVRDKHGNIIRGNDKGGNNMNRKMDRNINNDFSMNNIAPLLPRDDINWGNTYGLSPQFLQSLNIEPPLTTRVFVANLEYNVNEKKIREIFRLAGKIVDLELSYDKEGKSRGFGIVEFDHPVEAVQAVSMLHGQHLYDRKMSVKLDRANEHLKLPDGLRAVGMGLGANGEPLRNVSLNLSSNSSAATESGGGILENLESDPLELASALSGLSKLTALTNKTSSLPALSRSLLGGSLSDITSLASLVGQTSAPPPRPFVAPTAPAADRLRAFSEAHDNARRLFGRGVGGGPSMAGGSDRSRFSNAGH